jgi:hypothetical protein
MFFQLLFSEFLVLQYIQFDNFIDKFYFFAIESITQVIPMKGLSLLAMLLCLLLANFAYFDKAEAQALMLSPYHKSPIAPAFEKIYIDPQNLVYMPEGLTYFEEDGTRTKVGAVLHDCYGTYILQIEYQCPLCGRTYLNKGPDEEHGCPLFMHKVHPKIWSK